MRFRFAILALALATACSAGLTDPQPGAELRVGGSLLRIESSATSRYVAAGQVDTLRTTLTNDGPAAVTLTFGSGCTLLPYIRNSAGTIVLPMDGGWACTAVVSHLTLQPGERITGESYWSGFSQFTTEMPLVGRLPAGTYYFTAEIHAQEGSMSSIPLAIELQ